MADLAIKQLTGLRIADPINPDTNKPLTNLNGEGGFAVAQMTTAQRDNLTRLNPPYTTLTPACGNGTIIYNTDTNQFNIYQNNAWLRFLTLPAAELEDVTATTRTQFEKIAKRDKELTLLLYSLRKRIEKLESRSNSLESRFNS